MIAGTLTLLAESFVILATYKLGLRIVILTQNDLGFI